MVKHQSMRRPAQFVLAHGEAEVDAISAHGTAQSRRRGRSLATTEALDALALARLRRAEREDRPRAQPDDASTALRLLSDHCDYLVAKRTRLITQRHAPMPQRDSADRATRGPLTGAAGGPFCPLLRSRRTTRQDTVHWPR